MINMTKREKLLERIEEQIGSDSYLAWILNSHEDIKDIKEFVEKLRDELDDVGWIMDEEDE
jgi:hypothetical protein